MSLMGSAMENCRKWGFGPDMDGLPRKGQHFLAKQALREIRDKVGMLAHTWLHSTRLLGTLAAPPHFSMIPGEHFTGSPAPSAPQLRRRMPWVGTSQPGKASPSAGTEGHTLDPRGQSQLPGSQRQPQNRQNLLLSPTPSQT